jgi:FtsZ-binding cell division protein ZapB
LFDDLSEEQVTSLHRELSTTRPKLLALEPEVGELRREKAAWQEERRQLRGELEALRQAEQSLAQLAADLELAKELPPGTSVLNPLPRPSTTGTDREDNNSGALRGRHSEARRRGYGQRYSSLQEQREYTDRGGGGSRSASRRRSASASPDRRHRRGRHHASDEESVPISRSQAYAAWTTLPSLRRLSPALYENIRRMSADLHRSEAQRAELEAAVTSLRKVLITKYVSTDL